MCRDTDPKEPQRESAAFFVAMAIPRARNVISLILLLAPCVHMFQQIPKSDVQMELVRTVVISIALYMVTSVFITSLALLTKQG